LSAEDARWRVSERSGKQVAKLDELTTDPSPVIRNAITIEKLKAVFSNDEITARKIFDAIVIYYQT